MYMLTANLFSGTFELEKMHLRRIERMHSVHALCPAAMSFEQGQEIAGSKFRKGYKTC
jgi:hypothetical protein